VADVVVFTELFRMRDTYGIPLGTVMGWCIRDGLLFSVPHFIRDAKAAGWKPRKILAELRAAWLDCAVPAKELAELMAIAERFVGGSDGS
jgi:hypothetical protein